MRWCISRPSHHHVCESARPCSKCLYMMVWFWHIAYYMFYDHDTECDRDAQHTHKTHHVHELRVDGFAMNSLVLETNKKKHLPIRGKTGLEFKVGMVRIKRAQLMCQYPFSRMMGFIDPSARSLRPTFALPHTHKPFKEYTCIYLRWVNTLCRFQARASLRRRASRRPKGPRRNADQPTTNTYILEANH